MDTYTLSNMEIDAVGEILNISLGASATAVSTMLDTRVDITTPVVKVKHKDEFEFASIEPAVGVQIGYVEGLDGSNIMLLKRIDVKVIVELLMGMEIPDDQFELDEMNISAICEVMNQMMGASAISLTEMIHKTVDINPPKATLVNAKEDVESIDMLPFPGDEMVIILSRFEAAKLLKGIMIRIFPMTETRFICDNFKTR